MAIKAAVAWRVALCTHALLLLSPLFLCCFVLSSSLLEGLGTHMFRMPRSRCTWRADEAVVVLIMRHVAICNQAENQAPKGLIRFDPILDARSAKAMARAYQSSTPP